MQPSPDVLSSIAQLYEHGRYWQAWELAQRCAPLARWQGSRAAALAGRLASQLGDERLGQVIRRRSCRAHPGDLQAAGDWLYILLEREGPLAAWEALRTQVDDPAQAADVRADWRVAGAGVYHRLRDFARAAECLDRAAELAPGDAWIVVGRAYHAAACDRPGQALDLLAAALAINPDLRPALQSRAHHLHQAGRDDEALSGLTVAAQRLEVAALWSQLAVIHETLDHPVEALACLDRYEQLSPLRRKDTHDWLAARRCDLHAACGDRTAAIAAGSGCAHPFIKDLVANLAAAPADARRVELAVPYVRQDHNTCAPATLAALARFWGTDADHQAVAEAICYDGTPDWRERAWAEDAGFATVEFTVTWDSAVALLDRGVPFTLTTTRPDSAHLQAVVGYDAARGTLLIRDPGSRYRSEAMAKGLLASQRAHGPRGMALVPRAQTDRLTGLELPERDLRDLLNRLRGALGRHDRTAAAAAATALAQAAPVHALSCQARRNLAWYDADPAAAARASADWLALHPELPIPALAAVNDLRGGEHRAERLRRLETLAALPSPPAECLRRLAEELRADHREHARAERLLRRAIAQGSEGPAWADLADLRWRAGSRDQAVDLYRIASCLNAAWESYAQAYHRCAHWQRRGDEALAHLRQRVAAAGARSSEPALTLCGVFDRFDRTAEAQAVLAAALALRPEDGDLLLAAARYRLAWSDETGAAAALAAAAGRAHRSDWLRAAAAAARRAGDTATALAHWQEVLEREAMNVDAQRAVASLLSQRSGRPAALAHLAEVAARFPHHVALAELRYDWLRDSDQAAAVLRGILDAHPDNAWAWRELAWSHLRAGRLAEAASAAEPSWRLDGPCVVNHNLRGDLALAGGDRDGARREWRAALTIDADSTWALDQLIAAGVDAGERRADLAWYQGQLESQVLEGTALEAFRRHAAHLLDADAMLAVLRAAHAARPDLWQSWSQLGAALMQRDLTAEAKQLATSACERFPLLPRVWIDLANACAATGDGGGRRQALERAGVLSPGWSEAATRLAECQRDAGDRAGAIATLERAIGRDPLEAHNHGWLAELLLAGSAADQRQRAGDHLERALRIDRGYGWAWDTLARHDHARALALAHELTAANPGDAEAWIDLANLLADDARAEALAALDRALVLAPRYVNAHDLRARLLAESGDQAGALAATRPAAWGEAPPARLRRRAAWVRHRGGDGAAARAELRRLLADDPNDQQAWSQLSDWCLAAGGDELAEAETAAVHLTRLAPRVPQSWGYLGDARRARGDRAGAKEALARALALDPDYRFAGNVLFDLHCRDRELDAAEAVLGTMAERSPGGWMRKQRVDLAVLRRSCDAAVSALAALCAEADPPGDAIDQAITAMTKAGWGGEASRVVDEAIEREQPPAGLCWAWGASWALTTPAARVWPRLAALVRREGLAADALLGGIASGLCERPDAGRVGALVAAHGPELRADRPCWGMVGEAWMLVGRPTQALAWLDRGRGREPLASRELFTLSLAARGVGDDVDAHTWAAQAQSLAPVRATRRLRCWLAFDAALHALGAAPAPSMPGDVAAHRARIDQGELWTGDRLVLGLAETLAACAAAGGGFWAACRAAHAIQGHIAHCNAEVDVACNVYLRRAVLRAAGALARRAPVVLHVWSWWLRADFAVRPWTS